MIYAQRGGMDIMVPTTCGQKNTQIFGEILQVASWEGSYTNVVPVESECACHRLCVLHIAQGCRSRFSTPLAQITDCRFGGVGSAGRFESRG